MQRCGIHSLHFGGNGSAHREEGKSGTDRNLRHSHPEECRRSWRKQRNRDQTGSGQNGHRFGRKRGRVLRIDHSLGSRDALRLHLFHHIAARLASAQMQERGVLPLCDQKLKQVLRIPLGRNRVEAFLYGNRRCPRAHAEGKPRQARAPQPPRRTGAGFRCQDHSTKRASGKLWLKTYRMQQRCGDRRHTIPEARFQVLCKALSLRIRPGDQNRKGAGLQGHGLGVTCGRPLTQWHGMQAPLTFLGIESSCDDTAAAVVRAGATGAEVLSSVVEGQAALHAAFGGVVPEIAARAHIERLDGCVEQALHQAGLRLTDLDGIAVTAGPGLIGGVLSGVMLAKGLAAATGLPLVGVNHLAGHALTPRLTDGLAYPYLLLLVSGGHCQFLITQGPASYRRLGGTIDDAPGEAFDKVAKMLGLAQPGGPVVEAEAQAGDAQRFPLPRPLLDRPGCDLSFSGLKTAVLRQRDQLIATQGGLTQQDRRDLCAGFQRAVADVLVEKTRRAIGTYLEANPESPALAVAGGVAANMAIRARLETLCAEMGLRFTAPPLRLCTDNAAMIAFAGIERFQAGGRDGMDLSARPRWPLDDRAPALIGSGKKGAKA